MVTLQTVRANNSSLKSLGPGLVAVFVGGTSGIGLSTAREFVQNTTSPTVYLIGRSQSQADTIITELTTLNPTSTLKFLQSDVSSLKNVDSVCSEILSKEKKLNLLFMTTGYLTFKGRDETPEGLDRKLTVHYYSRMRFVSNLMPLLDAAATSPSPGNLSRVISVLDPNLRAGNVNFDDLSLKHNFSLKNCAAHAITMTNFYLEAMAGRHPNTTFIHAYPGAVKTNAGRELPYLLQLAGSAAFMVLRLFFVGLKESGERHLYAATAPLYAPRREARKEDVAVGSDGSKGSGSYWLHWNGDVLPASSYMTKIRGEGVEDKIVEHTKEVFRKVCDEGGSYAD